MAAIAGYKLDTNQSTRVMLEQFCVGTDKTTTYPGDPRPESIRPIREVEYKSPLLKSNEITSGKWRDKKDNDMDCCNPVLTSISESKLPIPQFNGIIKFDNEMVQVQLCIEALTSLSCELYIHLRDHDTKRKRNPIRQRLIKYRAERIIDKLQQSDCEVTFDRNTMVSKLVQDIHMALENTISQKGSAS